MPTIYEYFGIVFLFHYRDEHLNDIHVHIRYAGTESKADIKYVGGKLSKIVFKKAQDCKPIPKNKEADARAFIEKYHKQITEKWIQAFIKKSKPKFEAITKKIK